MFYNCTIAYNNCTEDDCAGGISAEDDATFYNCISYSNTNKLGEANNLFIYDNSDVTVSHCAVETGNAVVGSDNNIGLDESPFVGTDEEGSLNLKDGSVCIDAGIVSEIVPATKTDLSGNMRVVNQTIDLGAYEWGSKPVTTEPGSEPITETEIASTKSGDKLYYTKGIVYSKENVVIKIYSMIGDLCIAGSGTEIDASILETGVYIATAIVKDKIVSCPFYHEMK